MVTLFTIMGKIKTNSFVLPRQCIYVFCVDHGTKSDIFVRSINRTFFTTQAESVYCAVRSESSYKTNYVLYIFHSPTTALFIKLGEV